MVITNTRFDCYNEGMRWLVLQCVKCQCDMEPYFLNGSMWPYCYICPECGREIYYD